MRGTNRVRGAHSLGDGVAAPEPKVCHSCGRTMQWRKAWERSWPQRRYCSQACRARGVQPVDRALEEAILDLLAKRAHHATICPSDAARLVAGDGEWRPLMEPARRAARRLVMTGSVVITQGGRIVDPSTARGPIRIRMARPPGVS